MNLQSRIWQEVYQRVRTKIHVLEMYGVSRDVSFGVTGVTADGVRSALDGVQKTIWEERMREGQSRMASWFLSRP